MARVIWRDGHRYPYSDGYVSDRHLFSIRAGGATGTQLVMWSPLSDHGDFLERPEKAVTRELLKARAERLLEEFVAKAGAVFPGEGD